MRSGQHFMTPLHRDGWGAGRTGKGPALGWKGLKEGYGREGSDRGHVGGVNIQNIISCTFTLKKQIIDL